MTDRAERCCFPAAFLDALAARVGHFVQLSLIYPIGMESARTTMPTGRLVAVRSNYIALADVHINGVAYPQLGIVEIVLGYVVSIARATPPG